MIDLSIRTAVIVLVVEQILVQSLTVHRQLFSPSFFNRSDARGCTDMHHVQRSTFNVFGQPQYPAERQVLRQDRVHFSHVLETGSTLLKQTTVHVHDQVVVLGVDYSETTGSSHGLEHFPHVAEVNHSPASARRDVCCEYLDRRIAGLDDFRYGIDQFQRHTATEHQVIGIVAVAAPLPILVTTTDGLLKGLPLLPRCKVDHCSGAAVQCRPTDL